MDNNPCTFEDVIESILQQNSNAVRHGHNDEESRQRLLGFKDGAEKLAKAGWSMRSQHDVLNILGGDSERWQAAYIEMLAYADSAVKLKELGIGFAEQLAATEVLYDNGHDGNKSYDDAFNHCVSKWDGVKPAEIDEGKFASFRQDYHEALSGYTDYQQDQYQKLLTRLSPAFDDKPLGTFVAALNRNKGGSEAYRGGKSSDPRVPAARDTAITE